MRYSPNASAGRPLRTRPAIGKLRGELDHTPGGDRQLLVVDGQRDPYELGGLFAEGGAGHDGDVLALKQLDRQNPGPKGRFH